jgi:Uncharacterized conserved protein (DUF2285)
MREVSVKPEIADEAPQGEALTPYDERHLATYLRLLDAEAEGAEWREVARIVLGLDPRREPERAYRMWQSHLARAQWMTEHGYRHLLVRGYH